MIKTLADALRPFSFRGKARLLHALCSREGERGARVFGCRVGLDLGDYIQRSIYLGVFEPSESAQVRRYLKPGMTFADVGANVGYYTLLAAAAVGRAGRVLAFEPSPYAFGRLAEAVSRNGLSNVRAVPFGLGEAEGTRLLAMPEAPGNHTPSMVPRGEGRPLEVAVRRLDDCLAEWRVERVDLMKLDVEGFEPNVVEGALGYITRGRVGALLCEFNSHWLERNGTNSEEFFRRLTGLGFRPAGRPPRFAETATIQNVLFTYGA
jgi:FkbM family methyltransferase